MRCLLSLVLPLLLVSPLHATSLTLHSGPERVSVLELYTSEGCSSCPPADRWLSTLRDDPRLWRELVPVAFHVDYWDRLGWVDRFASSAHSERQHRHAQARRMRTIYTPGLFLDGEEWRGWFHAKTLSLEPRRAAGELALELQGREISARYSSASAIAGAPLELHVAVLGFDLRTQVQAGENRGRELTHDFVVLAHDVVPMTRADSTMTAQTTLRALVEQPPRAALAVWVSLSHDPAPLQAVGGWLPRAD